MPYCSQCDHFHRSSSRHSAISHPPTPFASVSPSENRVPAETVSFSVNITNPVDILTLLIPMVVPPQHVAFQVFLQSIMEINRTIFDAHERERVQRREIISELPKISFTSPNLKFTSCMICLSDFETGETLKMLPCGHSFHGTCVDSWLLEKPTCPLCRASIGSTIEEMRELLQAIGYNQETGERPDHEEMAAVEQRTSGRSDSSSSHIVSSSGSNLPRTSSCSIPISSISSRNSLRNTMNMHTSLRRSERIANRSRRLSLPSSIVLLGSVSSSISGGSASATSSTALVEDNHGRISRRIARKREAVGKRDRHLLPYRKVLKSKSSPLSGDLRLNKRSRK